MNDLKSVLFYVLGIIALVLVTNVMTDRYDIEGIAFDPIDPPVPAAIPTSGAPPG